jgi:hypothetical protein
MLPPGLATRASPEEDLLRRQEDVPASTKLKKSRHDLHSALREATSHSDLAALDLANGTTIPRAATPSENGEPLGVYRYGTLRVTNGAASPVPSLVASIGKSLELDIPRLPDLPEKKYTASNSHNAQLDQRTSQDYHTAPNTPQERSSMEYSAARTSNRDSAGIFDTTRPPPQTASGRQSDGERHSRECTRPSKSKSRSREGSISGIPLPQDVDEASPRIYRRIRPQRSRTTSQTDVPQTGEPPQSTRSRDSSLSRIPLRVETSRQSLRRLEPQVSALSLTAVKPEIDEYVQ